MCLGYMNNGRTLFRTFTFFTNYHRQWRKTFWIKRECFPSHIPLAVVLHSTRPITSALLDNGIGTQPFSEPFFFFFFLNCVFLSSSTRLNNILEMPHWVADLLNRDCAHTSWGCWLATFLEITVQVFCLKQRITESVFFSSQTRIYYH